MTHAQKYQPGAALYVLLFWLAVALIIAHCSGCGGIAHKSYRIDGWAGGADPDKGLWTAYGTLDSAPDNTTTVRYNRRRTTSIFNSASHDITETFFFVMPGTNSFPRLDALVVALRAANASTSSTNSAAR